MPNTVNKRSEIGVNIRNQQLHKHSRESLQTTQTLTNLQQQTLITSHKAIQDHTKTYQKQKKKSFWGHKGVFAMNAA